MNLNSYNELIEELETRFNLSNSAARQLIAIVLTWYENNEEK